MRLIWLFSLLSLWAGAQNTAFDFATQLSEDSMRSYMSVLTADSLEGRETGEPGQKKAAKFLVDHYQRLGIPVHLQHHSLNVRANSGYNLVINDQYFVYYQDFYYFGFSEDTLLEDSDVYLAGFGINQSKYHDFIPEKLKEKNVVVSWGQPQWKKKFRKEINRPTQSETLKGFIDQLLIGSPKSIFIDVDSLPTLIHQVENDSDLQKYLSALKVPVVFLRRSTTEKFIHSETELLYTAYLNRIKSKGKPNSRHEKNNIYLKFTLQTNSLLGENVIAFLEGSSKKDEVLFISSHYDHLGVNDSLIFHGADDNGSGTSAVMDIARVFAKSKREGKGPERSIVFMNVSGEEKGLLGSSYYVKHPDFPLSQVVADLNIDMVGRIDEKHDSLSNKDYVYVIGAGRLSKDLEDINNQMNDKFVHLDLDNTYDLPGDPNRFYERSDHYNFAKNKVPVIFYFNGVHADYHSPTDTMEKIHFELIKKERNWFS